MQVFGLFSFCGGIIYVKNRKNKKNLVVRDLIRVADIIFQSRTYAIYCR
jgi:hypothetical protein